MTLSRYIARRFLMSFGLVFAVFFGVMFTIQMVEEVRRQSDGVVASQLLTLAALAVPSSLFRILPLIAILAAIALFLGLARSSELVVVRAAGRSAMRMLTAPVVVAILLGAVAVAVFDPLVAATTKRYEQLAERYRLGERAVLSVGREGVWLRQGGRDGQTVIHALRANADGTALTGVTFLTFDAASNPVARIEAASADLGDGEWVLRTAKAWSLSPGANPEQGARTAERMTVPSDLTRTKIRDSFGQPSSIPIWELPAFIRSLERAGFSSRKHEVWLHTELALPLLLAAMVLVAAGFTMRHARAGGTGPLVLLAMVSGFGVFVLRNLAQVLGENGQIPVILAAWGPPVAAMMFALSLILHLEDG
jgi:lipopolysaccharide export system permease protein